MNKIHPSQMYPNYYKYQSDKKRLYELLSLKINKGLSNQEQLELSSLKFKVWGLWHV